jgi:hypothetical protein
MLQALKFGLAVAALFAAGASADACWGKRNCCAPTVACAAPAPVQFVEKKVTAYRCVNREKDVEVTVNTMVPRQVEVKYTAYEMKSEPVKQKVVRYELVPVEKEFKTTCMEMRMVDEKRRVCEYEKVMREVEYKYMEMIRGQTTVKKKVVTWKCDSKVVEEVVPVCHKILVRCEPDPCAGCFAACFPRFKCETVIENRKVCRTVVIRTPIETEVECIVPTCTPVERTGKRMVCELKPHEREITVRVCRAFPVDKIVKRCVTERREHVDECIVNVCKLVPVERKCLETVYDCKPEKKMVKKCWTEMEPYETVVRVPVGCPAPDCGPRVFSLFGR